MKTLTKLTNLFHIREPKMKPSKEYEAMVILIAQSLEWREKGNYAMERDSLYRLAKAVKMAIRDVKSKKIPGVSKLPKSARVTKPMVKMEFKPMEKMELKHGKDGDNVPPPNQPELNLISPSQKPE